MELVELFRTSGHAVFAHDLDLDITDYYLLLDRIPKLDCDLVINAAADIDADRAENDPDRSYSINFAGTQNLALVCSQLRIPLAFISSDYVFDGLKGGSYTEFDLPNPQGVYGKAKLAAETFMRSVLDQYYIFRTQWLFGRFGKRNFVKSILRNATENRKLRVVTDEVGSPTSAEALAAIVYEVVLSGRYGLYHATNEGSCSRFEFAQEIVSIAGLEGVEVEPITAGDLALPCPRPPFSPLDNCMLRLNGFTTPEDYHRPLEEYVQWLLSKEAL